MIAFVVMFVLVGTATGNAWAGVWAGVLAGAIAVLAYPYTACLWCGSRGGPRRMDRNGKNFRLCWLCRGSGKRLRFVAWLVRGGR